MTTIAAPLDLQPVELLAPGELDAGPTPIFEWSPVEAAVGYRLTLLGPAGPRRAWEGVETSVRYGGLEEGQAGPALELGSWWSVAAIDEQGLPVALSALRPVSPGDDPGPEPRWESEPEVPETTTEAEHAEAELDACDLLSTEDVGDVVGGVWESAVEIYPHDKGSVCVFTQVDEDTGAYVNMSLSPAQAYDPAGWNGEPSELLAGIGEESYLSPLVGSYLGVLQGERSVFFTFGVAPDPEAFAELARRAVGRLP